MLGLFENERISSLPSGPVLRNRSLTVHPLIRSCWQDFSFRCIIGSIISLEDSKELLVDPASTDCKWPSLAGTPALSGPLKSAGARDEIDVEIACAVRVVTFV
jgi:hypothetical protein